MKRLSLYFIVPLLLLGSAASAQDYSLTQMDSIVIGNPFRLQANANAGAGQSLFDRSPEVDIAKALYGQFFLPVFMKNLQMQIIQSIKATSAVSIEYIKLLREALSLMTKNQHCSLRRRLYTLQL